ncbi:MAG: polyphosphate kinase 2 family protein [Alphaproteobacteria bacterium]|nr:polyphosphate kinase 2 family protein [Alphaproteobacteria bacterium]
MFEGVSSPWRVPYDGSFRIGEAATSVPSPPSKKKSRKSLEASVARMRELQDVLYAQDKYAVLIVFQAMDAAGKDSTLRAVMTGVNPAGCQVFSFKQPSTLELDHDFLWRTAQCMPERGRIGIFNRSYYEEVLVVKVHPEYLPAQRLPYQVEPDLLWAQRYESIRDNELHLARNGLVVLKFFLNVSKDEQRRRFLSRIDDPSKNWKFSHGDLEERALWPKYMAAYETAVNETSRPWAPWYAIPADDKPLMRATVADIIVRSLESLDLHYPVLDDRGHARLAEAKKELLAE